MPGGEGLGLWPSHEVAPRVWPPRGPHATHHPDAALFV